MSPLWVEDGKLMAGRRDISVAAEAAGVKGVFVTELECPLGDGAVGGSPHVAVEHCEI